VRKVHWRHCVVSSVVDVRYVNYGEIEAELMVEEGWLRAAVIRLWMQCGDEIRTVRLSPGYKQELSLPCRSNFEKINLVQSSQGHRVN